MKMHSFRVHLDGTVTWTLQHDSVQDRPKPESKGPKTARTQRSRAPEPSGSNQSKAGACSHALIGLKDGQLLVIGKWGLVITSNYQ